MKPPRPLEILEFYLKLSLMMIWMVIASAIAMPLALIRWKNVENSYLFGVLYGPIARKIMGIRVVMKGEEYLRARPAVFACNHQSGLDMAILSRAYPPGAVVIGKKEVRRIPFFGLMFEAFGNVLIDRKNRENSLSGLKTAVETMKRRNCSVFIFPEGTRNASGEGLLPFKKGAFHMAIQSQAPIVPILSSKVSRLVSFNGKYARSGTIVIRVLPPISTTGMKESDVDALSEKTRKIMLEALQAASQQAEALDGVRSASL